MYYLNNNISLDSEVYTEHDVKTHREYCRRRTLNIPNIMSVPTKRLHICMHVYIFGVTSMDFIVSCETANYMMHCWFS